MKNVLVSGAGGFVGQALCPLLESSGWTVCKTSRHPRPGFTGIGNIGPTTDWRVALEGVTAVAHLAARVHVMHDEAADPLVEFRNANRDASANLARQAAQAGVKRFIYLSSIKVNGERTPDHPFRATDPANPQDAYAVSKWEAEQALHEIAAATGLEVVVLRPPLVYGPGVKANFLRLLNLVERGIPLPLGMVKNRRSLFYVGNLADAIRVCLEHPSAAGKTFLPCDGTPLSSADLVRRIAAALGKSPRLLPIPPTLLKLAGLLTGKSAEIARLLDSLEIDDSGLQHDLGWRPPYTLEQGLAATAAWYRRERAR
ncbi:MAG: SDR family oxidoreductase [Sulfuricella sp.]|nr:SDR family oxidoreductase [Sulfuricella sp.]